MASTPLFCERCGERAHITSINVLGTTHYAVTCAGNESSVGNKRPYCDTESSAIDSWHDLLATTYPIGTHEPDYHVAVANAALINLGVNAHDDLVAALSGLICSGCHNRIGWNGPWSGSDLRTDWAKCTACKESRAALAKATEVGE